MNAPNIVEPGKEIATKPNKEVSPIDTVRNALEKMKPQFMSVLPKHITADRLCRVALTCVQQTPKLLLCDKKSLYGAIMRAAQLGLEPDGILGQAYLIPYGTNVQFIVGYKGLIDLARRSGEVSNIIAKEVCENDEFEVDFSKEIPFTHRPKLTGDRGEITHFWAMARFKDGGFHWDYLSVDEVLAIREQSSGWQSAKKYNKTAESPWHKNFVEMGKKTAIRRIAKYLPMSVQKAAITEDIADAGKQYTYSDDGEVFVYEDKPTIDGTADNVTDQKAIAVEKPVSRKKPKDDAVATPTTAPTAQQAVVEPAKQAEAPKPYVQPVQAPAPQVSTDESAEDDISFGDD